MLRSSGLYHKFYKIIFLFYFKKFIFKKLKNTKKKKIQNLQKNTIQLQIHTLPEYLRPKTRNKSTSWTSGYRLLPNLWKDLVIAHSHRRQPKGKGTGKGKGIIKERVESSFILCMVNDNVIINLSVKSLFLFCCPCFRSMKMQNNT